MCANFHRFADFRGRRRRTDIGQEHKRLEAALPRHMPQIDARVRARLHDAQCDERRECLTHGVSADTKPLGQIPLGRQAVSGLQAPVLQVGQNAGDDV
ncbi:hypothetical protein D9M70_617090 [compost metagenome]